MSANSKGKIRTGIVGIGNWGSYGHIPVLQLLPDFQIVAVSSRRKEYAAEIARKFGVPHAFTNAQELITHPEVDLVIVPTAQAIRVLAKTTEDTNAILHLTC